MHRLFNLCLWQVLFAGVLLTSAPNISAQEEAGVSIRGPKSTDAYPHRRYGPINSNDTLWKIAQKIRPNDNVSIYQVMQALFERNPNAFANNNINHLIDGEYLVIPTLADVRVVDENKARKKSESDAKAWQNTGTVNVAKTEEKKKVVEKSASQKDLEAAKVEINEQLQNIDTEQKGRLETIQRDVLDSIDGLQAILKENESLKKRLGDFNEQLGTMQSEVAKGQEVKRDMDDMLALQRELLAKVEERERQLLLEKEQAFTSSIWFKVLLGIIPTLLILGGVLFFLRKKKEPQTTEKEKKVESAPEPTEEPVPEEAMELDDSLELDGELSLDDELAIDLAEDEGDGLFSDDLDDELSDELSDDDVIHLDDALDDLDELDDLEDISLEENFGDDSEAIGDDLDNLVEENDDLGDLLSGDDEEEGEALEGGSLDQNALDDLLSGIGDDEPEAESEPLEGGELGQNDLDDLLSGLDADTPDDDAGEEINVDDFLDEAAEEEAPEIADGADVTDPDDIDALLASAAAPEETSDADEMADGADVTDPDDIDALLASAAAPEETSAADEIADGADVTDPDDIDALLASAAAPEETSAADEIADGADVTDPDDIDALLASAAAPEETSAADEIADGADVTDPDDIDALLASAAAPEETSAADEIADGADVTDPDDIDALLASAAAPEETSAADEIADGADVTDPDDIDALLASAAAPEEASAADEIADGADVTDPDDIDALLASAAAPEEASVADEIADGADVTDPDDIDALLASAAAPEETNAADEIADGADVTDPDDIDALLASAGISADSDAPANVADDAEVTDPDDIDALLASAGVSAIADEEVTEPENIDAIIDSLADEENNEPVTAHEITDPAEIDALLEQEPIDDLSDVTEIESVETEPKSDHESLIEEFSEEYIAPFLQVDFSDITDEKTEEKAPEVDAIEDVPAVDPAIDKILNVEANENKEVIGEQSLTDDIDIDALISDVQTNDDSLIDIGDDILGNIEAPEEVAAVDDETLSAMEGDFDESTLSELLKEEKDPAPAVELTPDFTDSNVLADLLAEGEVQNEAVSEASVIEDIQELDSLDFDELLQNIEESSPGSDDSFDLADGLDIGDDIDLGDDLDVDIDTTPDVDAESSADDFVSVDSLLSESLDKQKEEEPYNKTNINVGLNEFPEFTDDINDVDVDDDDNGVAAKLDLAKVYIEIGDKENAEIILQDVVSLGDAQQQFDAQQLLDNL